VNSATPTLLCFDIGNAVLELMSDYPRLTPRDIDSITEQALWSYTSLSTLRVRSNDALEIERLPDSYGIIRDISECHKIQHAFTVYRETLRQILLAYGMEEMFVREDVVLTHDRFITGNTRIVLRCSYTPKSI
jgi:hypothetical protein